MKTKEIIQTVALFALVAIVIVTLKLSGANFN